MHICMRSWCTTNKLGLTIKTQSCFMLNDQHHSLVSKGWQVAINDNSLEKIVEDSFENVQWRKVKRMQPMWLCILSGRRFDEAFENTQWRKVKQMQQMWLCIFLCKRIEDTFRMHSGEKSNKCSQCNYASLYASSLRTHLKTHRGEKSNKCNQCDYLIQGHWGHI